MKDWIVRYNKGWYVLLRDRKLVSYSSDLKFLVKLVREFMKEDAKNKKVHKYKIINESRLEPKK